MWYDEDDETGTKWFYHSMVTMPKEGTPGRVAATHSTASVACEQPITQSSKNVAIETIISISSSCSSTIKPSNSAADHVSGGSVNDEHLARTQEVDEAVSMGMDGETNENELTLTDLSSLLWSGFWFYYCDCAFVYIEKLVNGVCVLQRTG
ncbi:unnamed protein product [Anisakis simplex]|uniref:NAC domain-containing protein n=1 Tax=Anisakis simplex TaxID=6269 RepID=A0A0M3JPH6_ANISI|nr:unnamed protein product [Anisakis simplex]